MSQSFLGRVFGTNKKRDFETMEFPEQCKLVEAEAKKDGSGFEAIPQADGSYKFVIKPTEGGPVRPFAVEPAAPAPVGATTRAAHDPCNILTLTPDEGQQWQDYFNVDHANAQCTDVMLDKVTATVNNGIQVEGNDTGLHGPHNNQQKARIVWWILVHSRKDQKVNLRRIQWAAICRLLQVQCKGYTNRQFRSLILEADLGGRKHRTLQELIEIRRREAVGILTTEQIRNLRS